MISYNSLFCLCTETWLQGFAEAIKLTEVSFAKKRRLKLSPITEEMDDFALDIVHFVDTLFQSNKDF